MSQRLWFRRKRYGWGWTPATWEGWVTTLIFVVPIGLLLSNIDEQSSVSEVFVVRVVPAFVLVGLLICLCYSKGEAPRWQWGDDQKKK